MVIKGLARSRELTPRDEGVSRDSPKGCFEDLRLAASTHGIQKRVDEVVCWAGGLMPLVYGPGGI
ncbi:MAG: hypothetical protein B6U65_00045 [Candidatus Wolframiiraptor sp. EX4484-121]|nr:MAG: hypothetical protein B6U65_00045 [Candidatus Wolframiiraptor sp. EX4484-121]